MQNAPHIPSTLVSEDFSKFDDTFRLPLDIHKFDAGALSNLMAKITSFRSFLLARISTMRIQLDNAQKKYKRAKAVKYKMSDATDGRKWKLEAECDTDKTLCMLEDEADSWHHAVSVTEAWASGLEEKYAVLSREIALRGLDVKTHGKY